MKVCPKCGKTENDAPFIEYFCRDCYLEDNPVVHIPDKLEILYCPLCERIYTSRWSNFSLEALRDWLKKKIRVDVDDASIGFSFPEMNEDEVSFLYIAKGNVKGAPFELSGKGEIQLKKMLCPRCARESGGYYEAIVQIRGRNAFSRAEEVAHMIAREKGEFNFVSKVVDKKEGVDLYVGSRKVADKVARKIEKRYGVKPVRSYTLVTERDGKRLYRLTVALHFRD